MWRVPFGLSLYLPLLLLIGLLMICPGAARAQTDPDETSAPADTTDASLGEETTSKLGQAVNQAKDGGTVQLYSSSGGLFNSLKNEPKAGAKANVRLNTYYGELVSTLKMRSEASFTNTMKWSYDEYRKQDKNAERRSDNFTYNLGQSLPVILRFDGERSWSEDRTVNTAGFANLFAQDNKSLRVAGSKSKFHAGAFTNSFRFGGSLDDRKSENQGTANNSNDASVDGGLQTGWRIQPGLVIAGRVSGSGSRGEKTLGAQDSPSSSHGDSLGVGLYFHQNFANGRVHMTRSSFSKKYLDFKKNASGLIDTVGADEADKVVDELETRDAMTIEFETKFSLGPMKFMGGASRTTNDQDFQVNGLGQKERLLDRVDLQTEFGVGADTLTVSYDYGWKWEDQRLQGATSNRGRQYNKSRDLEFIWERPFFKQTKFRALYHQGLSQDIAQFEHNKNDKDRLQSDFSLQIERIWPLVFRTKMVYTFRQTKDLSIRESRSSNNNILELYELTPSYTWFVSPWLSWDQNYRVSIQYTDYIFSDLPTVTRQDNYNKRGNLTTKVTFHPSDRLQVVFRHDYNKKFNATKSGVDASGSTFYSRDLNQTIGKLDMGMKFKVMPGVTLEAATYRTRDDRESPGRANSETTEFAGEMWMGTRVVQNWRSNISLSAVVKKFNAFGPSVTETSANYWEADIWLKWSF